MPKQVREEIWVRVFIDKDKVPKYYRDLGTGDARKFLSSLTLNLPVLQISGEKLVEEPEIDSIITELIRKAEKYTTTEFVKVALNKSTHHELEGKLVYLAADEPPKEHFQILQPEGRPFPVLSHGSYLVYRPPFSKVILPPDGEYHVAYLIALLHKFAPGSKDAVAVLFRSTQETDMTQFLRSIDNHHARLLGVVGPTLLSYRMHVAYQAGEEPKFYNSRIGVYALALDVKPMVDLGIMQRLEMWRDWGYFQRS